MIISRLSGSFDHSWELIETELRELFGDPKSVGDNTLQWVLRSSSIVTIEALANQSAGELDVIFRTKIPYAMVSILSLTIGVLSIVTNLSVALLGIVVGLGVALFPLVTWIFWVPFRAPMLNLITVEDYQVTPFVCLSVVGFLLSGFAGGGPELSRGLTVAVALFMIPFCLYITSANVASLRQHAPAFMYVFISSFPLLITLGNFGFLSIVTDQLGLSWVVLIVGILVGQTLVFGLVFVYICRMFLNAVRSLPFKPITSLWVKVLWWGYFGGLNGGFALLLGSIIIDTDMPRWVDLPVDVVYAGMEAANIPASRVTGSLALIVLGSPLLALGCLWVWNLLSHIKSYRAGRNTTELHQIENESISVHMLNTSMLVAYPFRRLTGEKYVIVSQGMMELLEEDELQAVIAHERYHLHHRDYLRNMLAAVFGLFIGGKNTAIAMYDYAKIEQQADEYAVSEIGATPLIRALRRIDSETMTAAGTPTTLTQKMNGWWWPITASYEVLFGSVLLNHAHADIDERIEHISTYSDQ